MLLAAMPVGTVNVPGLVRQTHRLLPPTGGLPKSGTPLAVLMDGRSLRLPRQLAAEHTLLLGPTGTGKTNAMLTMALDHLEHGRAWYCSTPRATVCGTCSPASRLGGWMTSWSSIPKTRGRSSV